MTFRIVRHEAIWGAHQTTECRLGHTEGLVGNAVISAIAITREASNGCFRRVIAVLAIAPVSVISIRVSRLKRRWIPARKGFPPGGHIFLPCPEQLEAWSRQLHFDLIATSALQA